MPVSLCGSILVSGDNIMKDRYKTKGQLISELVEVHPGVLVLQLNGKQDSQGVQKLTEGLRERIVEANSSVVVIDLTNMPAVDTQTTQHIIDSISTVRGLGKQVVLAGIRPPIDRKLTHLGVDLSSIMTCSSLVTGLWAALDIVESQVANKTNRGEIIRRDERNTKEQPRNELARLP